MIRFSYFILGLSILVTLHEMGHYIAARMFKTRVEKFYLFFDFLFPFPHIFNFAIFKKKIGDTEYGLGWFPFGGYVKIAGMIDESMDEEFLKSPPKPYEFRSKPAWQRLIIMLGGIIVNVLLAWVIYAMLLFAYGDVKLPVQNVKYGYVADSLAQSIGLRTGDKILGYDHKVEFTDAANPIVLDLLLNNAKNLQVERNGQKMDIEVPESVYEAIINSSGKMSFLTLAYPAVEIDSVLDESPLKGKAQKGDRIVYINNQPIQYFTEIGNELVRNMKQDVTVGLLRGTDTIRVAVKVPEDAKLKISLSGKEDYFVFDTVNYSLLAAIPAGAKQSIHVLGDYVKQFRILFSPKLKGYKQIGGFASISKLYPNVWDWHTFWKATALLSLILAFMNLLPIPVLDGGHALFTIVEMVTGKAPNEKFLERAQTVGMVMILALLILANGNDLMRFLTTKFG